jgi:Cu(I)/Ag(I) efflux system membrane fusion protein
MNKRTLLTALMIASFVAGALLGPKLLPTPEPALNAEPARAERDILYWVAPMDPNFRRDKPGKSPMGMDLVPVYADEASQGDEVVINPAVVNNLGVRSAPAQVRPLWRRIEATGFVGFDETRISHINTRVAGWIVGLPVAAEGERVSQGDLLFEFYSPELVNAQKEYLQAAQRNDRRLLSGADEKLRALGMAPSDIAALARRKSASENIRVLAPQDGIVATLSARKGMYVQPNTTIMSLADLSSVWLQAEVFESQAEWVAAGQAAEARLEFLPGSVFSSQVDHVYPVLDPATRTLRVRLRFDNPDERLKPNMYAGVSIFGRLRPAALSIPREALIPAPGHDRVVLALGAGRFQVREVLTGLESGEFVEILAGIEEGDEVVTSAQFLIDSEASLAGSIQRLASDIPPERERLPEPVFGSGRVEEIDATGRRVRIAHGPIEALGWPSMTMVFSVRPGVDLGIMQVGQNVRFALEQAQAGEYELTQLFSGMSSEGMSEVVPEQEEPPVAETRRIMAEGTIREVMAQDRKLRMTHAPIPELNWPTMTMNFRVTDRVDLSALDENQSIHFVMVQEGDAWVIDEVHLMGQTMDEEHDHD